MRIVLDNAPRARAGLLGPIGPVGPMGPGWSRRRSAAPRVVRGGVCPPVTGSGTQGSGAKAARTGHGMPAFVRDLRHRPAAP